jgi:hypothetical protein
LSGLAKKGYTIAIVSFEKSERYQAGRQSIREQCDAVEISWYPQVYHKRPAILSTIYDLYVLWRISNQLIKDRSVEIVHCRSYLTALIGLQLKRKTGVKMIFDMRGFWADERVEGNIWSLDKALYRFIYQYFKRAERKLIKLSDQVVVLTQAAKEEIKGWHLSDRIAVIPCCVDLQLFDASNVSESQKEELRGQLGIKPEEFVLLYLGSLGTWYMTTEMMAFYHAIRAHRPDAKFLVLTPDVDAISEPGIIVRTVKRNDVPKYIALSNASICYIRPTFSKKGSSATKMGEVLAMNIPVVSNVGWGDVEFLHSRVNGLFLTSVADVVPQELFIRDSPTHAQTKFFFEYFSLAQGVQRYEEIYGTLIREHKT